MKDRVVVVTGAGSGVGAAVARLLASQEALLVLVGRRLDALERTTRSLTNSTRSIVVSTDLADDGSAADIAERAVAAFGRIDGLVNSAALSAKSNLADLSVDELIQLYRVNAIAPVAMTQACLPGLRLSDAPSVVNLSSALSVIPKLDQLAYGMSKAALEYATRALAHGLAHDRIRVNAVAPGPVETPMHDGLYENLESAYAQMASTTLAGRIGQPDEVARWVVDLLSPESSWVTGAIVRVDGGRTIWPPGAA